MLAKNCTLHDLQAALAAVNKKYAGNIALKNPRAAGKAIRFTLTVISSRAPGSRLGFPSASTGKQRHIVAACWHVHGDFFDALLNANRDAVIQVSGRGDIYRSYDGRIIGNWEDSNIGSMYRPLYYSEACECQ